MKISTKEQILNFLGILATGTVTYVGFALGGKVGKDLIAPLGINLGSTIIQSGSVKLKEHLLSSNNGIRNHDIKKALTRAIINSLKELESRYIGIVGNSISQEEKKSITRFFEYLNKQALNIFPECLENAIEGQDVKEYLYEKQETVASNIWERIHKTNLLDDHHREWFKDFFIKFFFIKMQFYFFEELKADTRAWRAFQSMMHEGIKADVYAVQRSHDLILQELEEMKKLDLQKLEEIRKEIEKLKDTIDQPRINEPFQSGLEEAIKGLIDDLKYLFTTTHKIDDTTQRTEKKVDAAKETIDAIKASMEEFYPSILARIPISLQQFMTLDVYLSSSNQRFWPKWKDVQEGKLYCSESHIKKIENKLLECGRCLLTGASGSGKTAQAIAFGLWWYGNVEIRIKHPIAVVSYLDAIKGNTAEKGEDWYREVMAHDYYNGLYIIDNCHLGTLAVNAFCYQWELKRPEHALVLLISTPKVLESPWEDEPEDYFDSFEQDKAIVSVQPEQIYKGILQKYSDAYKSINPQHFIPVEKDLSDLNRTEKLDRLCSHNLAITRSILEAWGDVGGWLSDVTEEVALGYLARRYLIDKKAPALAPLCSLGQFEILIHDRFIRQLPQESVNALSKENLIIPEDSELYGRCHRVSFHPQVASLIFRAYLYQQMGYGFEKRIEDEIFQFLKKYLSCYPENFIMVYSRLYRLGASELQHRLLRDAELQTYAFQQFTTRPINEVIQYLYALYSIHPDQAKNLLQGFVNQITAEKLQKEVLALTSIEFCIVSLFLTKINPEISLQVLGKLPPNWVFERIKFSNLSDIGAWIRPTSSSIAAKLGYSVAWRQQIAKMLDLDDLVIMALRGNPLSLFWFINAFIEIDKERAKLFVDKLSPEIFGKRLSGISLNNIRFCLELMKKLGYDLAFRKRFMCMFDITYLFNAVLKENPQALLWFIDAFIEIDKERAKLFVDKLSPERLGKKLSGQPLSIIGMLLNLMNRLGYDSAFRQRIVSMFDITSLLVNSKDTSLQHLYWILRDLKDVEPELAEHFFTDITPAGLAEMFRKKKGTAQNIQDFLKVSDLQFKREFIRHMGDEDIVTIFGRSKLGHIGTLLENYFHLFELPYSIFAAKSLHNLLATQEISELGKFIARLHRVPKNGQRLAVQASELMLKTDLTHRVTESDAEALSILLLNVYKVNPNYPNRILSALTPSYAVEKSLQHSGIRGIQLLLRNLSEMAPEFLPIISKSLRTLDMSDQIMEAEIKDLGHFLWNIRAYMGIELAQSYCRIVDSKLRSEQIARANLTDLGSFLWNLVHISDMEELRTLDMPVLKERLLKEWETNPGQCVGILGIIVVTCPNSTTYLNISALDIDRMSLRLTVRLTELLKEEHPYELALTVKGLQVLDESRTVEIVRNSFFNESIMDKYLKLIRKASTQAVTPCSKTVLEDNIKFIQWIKSSS